MEQTEQFGPMSTVPSKTINGSITTVLDWGFEI
jgi:hypothetical protein